MNNKIKKKRTDIESGSLSAVIGTTSFVVILVLAGRISSTIREEVYSAVEKEKEYEKIEQKRNDSDSGEKETKKLYYTQNLDLISI